MLEVERKYRSPGNDKVEKALARIGARKLASETIEDIYFSHPSRDFGKTDESLRLRKMEQSHELTYKGPRMQVEGSKAREEITIGTSDALGIQRIVERLGFKERLVIKKKRGSYQYEKLKIEVDDVEELGEYVELELMTESPGESSTIMETVRKELDLEKIEHRTYMEMLVEKHEGKARG